MTIFQADSLAISAELDQFEMVTKADQQDRGRVKWLSKTKKYLISFAFLNRLVSVGGRFKMKDEKNEDFGKTGFIEATCLN